MNNRSQTRALTMTNDNHQTRAALTVLRGLHDSNTEDRKRFSDLCALLDESREALYMSAMKYRSQHMGLAQTLESARQILGEARQKLEEMDKEAKENLKFLEAQIEERTVEERTRTQTK